MSDSKWSTRPIKEEDAIKPDVPRSKEIPEPNLYQVLENLIVAINLDDKNWRKHDIIKALDRQGIIDWDDFIVMEPEDVSQMTSDSGGHQVPLPVHAAKTISRIKELIWKNMDNNVPGASLPSTYTRTMYLEYVSDLNFKKRNNASYNVLKSGVPSFTSSASSNKSVGEKRYKGGFAYLKMCPFTTDEWNTLPHVMMTSDQIWDPNVFDVDIDPNGASFLATNPQQLHKLHQDYDEFGEYIRVNQLRQIVPEFDFWMSDGEYHRHQTIARCMYSSRMELQAFKLDASDSTFTNGMQPRDHTPNDIDYKAMQPHFFMDSYRHDQGRVAFQSQSKCNQT